MMDWVVVSVALWTLAVGGGIAYEEIHPRWLDVYESKEECEWQETRDAQRDLHMHGHAVVTIIVECQTKGDEA